MCGVDFVTGVIENEPSTVPANPSRPQWAPRYSSAPYRSQQTLELFLRCGPVVAFALSRITSQYLVRGLPSVTGLACGQASAPVFVQLDLLTLVRHVPCLIIVVSISDKLGTRSCCRLLAKPRVHRHNRVSMTRMRVVASSLVSPDHGVQRYRLRPSSRLRRYRDSRLVVLFLWAVPLETTPLLFRDLDSQLLAFPFPSDCLSFL